MKNWIWSGWQHRHLWPQTIPTGYTFLGHAFDITGAALFSAWSGREIEYAERDLPQRLPDAEDAYIDGKPHYGFHSHFGPLIREMAPSLRADQPIPSELWRVVAADRDGEYARIQESRFRRQMVVTKLETASRTGDLVFASRRMGGGVQPIVVPVERWEIDYPWLPFATLRCGADQQLCTAQLTDWLFVTTDSLKWVLDLGPKPSAPSLGSASDEEGAPGSSTSEIALEVDLVGRLPPSARRSDRKNEQAAHEVAKLIRRKRCSVAQAIRDALPLVNANGRDVSSVERGIRQSFNLMYDLHGMPLNN